MKLLVAINPFSGGGKGKSVGSQVRGILGQGYHQVTFVEAQTLIETLQQLDEVYSVENFDALIAVGGDGFIHDLLPFLLRHKLPLLVIPAGTGNDFARTLGLYGVAPQSLLDGLGISQPSSIDVALVEQGDLRTPFVQILSTGFDSVVNERANNFKRVKGSIKYAVAVLLEVWRFRSIDFEITIDEVPMSADAMLVCVANGTSYGAGMKIVPGAKNNDGLLDVLVVDRVNPLRLLMVFPRVFIGSHIKHPKVHLYSGKRIEISGATWAFADGEKIAHLPVQVSISSQPLLVYRS